MFKRPGNAGFSGRFLHPLLEDNFELMSKTSDEFEKRIAELQLLLSESGTIVKWNDKIPDPDNPTQARQIDATVNNGTTTIHVECRIHADKQDVKWIEELYGRKESLGADGLIAVSSSGFTAGAIKKAARFNIALRHLQRITPEDVSEWGEFADVFYEYFAFDSVRIIPFFASVKMAQKVTHADLRHFIVSGAVERMFSGLKESMRKDKVDYKDVQPNLKCRAQLPEPVDPNGCVAVAVDFEVTNLRWVKEPLPVLKALLFVDPALKDSYEQLRVAELAHGSGFVVQLEKGKGVGISITPDATPLPHNSSFIGWGANVKHGIRLSLNTHGKAGCPGPKNTHTVGVGFGYMDESQQFHICVPPPCE